MPAIKGFLLRRFGIEDAFFAVEFNDLPLVTGYSTVHRQVFTVQHAAEEFAMVGTSGRLQIGSFYREVIDNLPRSSAFADFFFEVGQGFGVEKRRYDVVEKIVEPVRFVQTEGLKSGLIEDQMRTCRHLAHDTQLAK